MTRTKTSAAALAALAFVVALVIAVVPGRALAQTFPADGAWRVLECDGRPATDPVGDEPAAVNERDCVGDAAHPAAYVFVDATYLFFRMRLDDDPTMGSMLRPFGWAVEFDSDADPTDYEVIAMVDGIANPEEVILSRNTNQATPNDPADPPEAEIARYPAGTHVQAVPTAGGLASSLGGSPDYFLDFAIDLADLAPEGITADTAVALVLGTSSSASAIDADIVCQDGAGGGPRTVVDTATDARAPNEPPPPDGDADTDGDGWTDQEEADAGTDPNDPNDHPNGTPGFGVRGGGGPAGCSAAPGAGSDSGWLVLLLFLAFSAGAGRRRSRDPR